MKAAWKSDLETVNTAKKLNILSKLEALSDELIVLENVTDVEFDLNELLSGIPHIIVLVSFEYEKSANGYANAGAYFDTRTDVSGNATLILRKHGLMPSGDAIEDYGNELYFVRRCTKDWVDFGVEKLPKPNLK
jgi:hypothetical protein